MLTNLFRNRVKTMFGAGAGVLALSALLTFGATAQDAQHAQESRILCPDGTEYTNGAAIFVDLRPGTYTVTAIGRSEGVFDSVIAVENTDTGDVRCNDDNADGTADFFMSLPSGEAVEGSQNRFNAQIRFEVEGEDDELTPYRVFVGGFNGSNGRTHLFIDGLRVTEDDAQFGDSFDVYMTSNLLGEGKTHAAYMIGVSDALDPLITRVDGNGDVLINDGLEQVCDDGGANNCVGGTSLETLDGSYVTSINSDGEAERIDAGRTDAYFFYDLNNETQTGYYYWRFGSFQNASEGRYVAVFQFDFGEPAADTITPAATPEVSLPVWSGFTSGEPIVADDEIEIDGSATGTITREDRTFIIQFEAPAGQALDAFAIADPTSSLDPSLLLIDEQGQIIASNDDSPAIPDVNLDRLPAGVEAVSQYDSFIASTFVPEDGTYYLVVTRYGGEGEVTVTLAESVGLLGFG